MQLAETRILVDDMDAARTFYRDVLGLTVSLDDDNYISFEAGENRVVALCERSVMADIATQTAQGDNVVVSFYVDNVDEVLPMLRERGATVVTEPTDRPTWGGVRTAHLRAPEGTLIEILHQIET